MNRKLISIIIPVYNTEQYLESCLISVCNQTFSNLEIIVVNDGSTDSSLNIINRYAQCDPRIVVFNQKNQGLSSARNRGLQMANGEYIIFLDSDDWLELDCCEIAYLEAEKSMVDVVLWSYSREYQSNSKTTLLFYDSVIKWDENNINDLFKRMVGLTGNELKQPQKIDALITAWGKLYRKRIINDIRFIDTQIIGTEDALFNIQIFSGVKSAIYLPIVMSHYRKDNTNSLTHCYKKKLVGQWSELYKRIEIHLNSISASEGFYHALSNRMCLGLIGLGMNLAEDTTMSFNEKRRELKRILILPHYKKALGKLETRYMPIKWQIFFGLARYQCVTALYCLACVMNYLRGK